MAIGKKALRRQIESAFADVPYPGDDNICRGFDDEFTWIARTFKGRHWKKMPAKAMLRNNTLATSLCVMTPEAFHFFLPGFMLVQIDYPRGEVNIVDELAPPQRNLSAKLKDIRGVPSEHMAAVREAFKMVDKNYQLRVSEYKLRISRLTSAQRRACIAFLNSLKPTPNSEEYRAIKALSSGR